MKSKVTSKLFHWWRGHLKNSSKMLKTKFALQPETIKDLMEGFSVT